MDAFTSRQVEGGLRKKNPDDGRWELPAGREVLAKCLPAGWILFAYSLWKDDGSLFSCFRDAAVFFLFILTLASLFAVSSHITHKTQKKDLTKARCPILNGPDIFTHWFFTIHVWISNAPLLPLYLFFLFFFFHNGADSQGSAARCQEAGDPCEAWD